MTAEQKIITAKLGLLELATPLGNVSRACHVMGYSRDSFYKLYDRKTPLTAADLLNDRVVPLFETHGIPRSRILTDRGTEYCGAERHEYELYLAVASPAALLWTTPKQRGRGPPVPTPVTPSGPHVASASPKNRWCAPRMFEATEAILVPISLLLFREVRTGQVLAVVRITCG